MPGGAGSQWVPVAARGWVRVGARCHWVVDEVGAERVGAGRVVLGAGGCWEGGCQVPVGARRVGARREVASRWWWVPGAGGWQCVAGEVGASARRCQVPVGARCQVPVSDSLLDTRPGSLGDMSHLEQLP